MNKKNILKNGLDMIYLASCALHGTVPSKEKILGMNIETVMEHASKHSMQAITYASIKKYLSASESNKLAIDEKLLEKYKAGHARSIKKIVLFEIEREKIFNFFDANDIWYLPLKGIILQHLYPEIGMRQMADNDILFDGNYREALKDFMLENQYTAEHYTKNLGSSCHDVYMKPPVLNFEMHHSLFSAFEKDIRFREYYQNIKDRLIKDEGNKCGYHMSDEDFYIYITTHSYKHYSGGGHGVRSLMDIYVYISKKQGTLDFDYIDRELEKLGISDFEKKARNLALKIFCQTDKSGQLKLTPDEVELLVYYITSGTYGTITHTVQNNLSKMSNDGKITFSVRFKYFIRRLFPDSSFYMLCHPTLYKYKILIPGFVLFRLFRIIFTRPKALISELKTLTSKNK